MSFPAPETIVELIAAGDVELTAEVVATTATGVTVEWAGDGPPSGHGHMRWPTPRGLHVLPCTIESSGSQGNLEATSEPLVIQRRDAVRVELRVPVRRLDGHTWERAQTINISSKGIRASGNLTLEIDEVGILAVELPDVPQDPLCTEVRVRHIDDQGLMGIEFLGLTHAQQERVMHVVFEQQRHALRARHTARAKAHLRLVKER